jgi:hypothetical protein
LSASGPSTLNIFFTWETKGMKGGFKNIERGKAAEYLENLLIEIFRLISLNRSMVTVLYLERTIAIYDCHLF